MMRIYLTNLGKYNEGHLIGEWVDLPVSDDDLEAVKERIGINEEYEEWFITDSECDIDGLDIGEYADIDELNDQAEQLEDLEEIEIKALQAFLADGCDFEDAIEHVNSGDFCYYLNCSDMEDVAQQYCDDCGILESIPDNLQCYFDFEAYGRDMEIEGNFHYIDGDYIQLLY